ncbi:MAG: hypothetical protein D6689_21540 [Deltaproteobacteria bacterium]|nr:MAG: hypothetical protein D6689_21540 [Deltaproteobacteria bacterium]
MNRSKRALLGWRTGSLAVAAALGLGAACSGSQEGTEPPPNGVDELAGGADEDGNIDAEVTLTVLSSIDEPPEALPAPANTPRPIVLEFEGHTKSGAPFRGVLLSADRTVGSVDFSGPMILRAQVLDWGGQTVLRGLAMAPETDADGSFVGALSWAFLAVAPDATLPTLPDPVAFDIDGARGTFLVACRPNAYYGAVNLTRARTGADVPAIMMASRIRGNPCAGGLAAGTAPTDVEGRSIDTHIGTLYLGRGLVHWSQEAGPLPIYVLGLPAVLSDREINPGFAGRYRDRVHKLYPYDLARIADVRHGELVFEPGAPILDEIAPGDVLVAKPFRRLANGFLRVVTDVRSEGDNTVVATRPAALGELVEDGEFTFDRTLTAADVVALEPLTDGVTITQARATWPVRLDLLPIPQIQIHKIVHDADGDKVGTVDDQLVVDGTLDLGAGLSVRFACRGTLCSDPFFRAKFSFDESADLSISGDVNWEGSRTYTLFSAKFAAIPIGVIVLTPKVAVQLTVEADASGSFQYHVDQSYSFDVGVKFDNGAFSPINDVTQSFDSDPVTVSGTLHAEGRLGVRGSLLLYGVTGVGLDVGAYVALDAESPRDPLWELYAGVDGRAFVELDLIVWNQSWDIDLFDTQWTLATAPNAEPMIQNVFVANMNASSPGGIAVYAGAPGTFRVRTYDPEQGINCCRVHVESDVDGAIGTTRDVVNDPVAFQFDTPGMRTITVTVTDDAGAQGQFQFDMDVQDVQGSTIVTPCWGFAVTPSLVGSNWAFDAAVTHWATEYGSGEPVTARCQAFAANQPTYQLNWYVDGVLLETDEPFDGTATTAAFAYACAEPGTRQVKAIAFNTASGSPSASDTVYVTCLQTNPMVDGHIGGQQTLESPGGGLSSSPVGADEPSTGDTILLFVTGDGAAEAEQVDWYDDMGNWLGTGESIEYTFEQEGTQTLTAELTDEDTGTTTEIQQEMQSSPPTGFGGYIGL